MTEYIELCINRIKIKKKSYFRSEEIFNNIEEFIKIGLFKFLMQLEIQKIFLVLKIMYIIITVDFKKNISSNLNLKWYVR